MHKVAVVYGLRSRVHPWWRGSWNLGLWGLLIFSMTPNMKPPPAFFGCCCRWLFDGRKSGTLQARWNKSAERIEFACIFEPTGSCGRFVNNFVGGAFGCWWIRTFYAVLPFASHWVEIPFSMSRLSPELKWQEFSFSCKNSMVGEGHTRTYLSYVILVCSPTET